jgi:hypothetical protein
LHGILAGLLTFSHLTMNCRTKPETPIQSELHTDNMAAIRKLNARRKNTRRENHHRDSDFDIENQIIQEIEALKPRATTEMKKYVKRHGINTKKGSVRCRKKTLSSRWVDQTSKITAKTSAVSFISL